MRIPSTVSDQYIYFVAVDASDFTTRETGLSSFTVYRSRNGGTATAMTTPTINEVDATNMPGVYELLLDEDMTIDSGDQSQEMCFHITHAGMAPVTRTIEIYRPSVSLGNTIAVSGARANCDVVAVSGDTTAADNLEAAYDGTGYDVGGIDVSELNSIIDDLLDAGRLDALIDAIKAKTDGLNFTGTAVDANPIYWNETLINTTDPFSSVALETSIQSLITTVGVAGAGLSAIPWNAAWDAEVQSEVADALAAFAWTGITISAVSGAVGSVTGNVGGNVTGSVGSLDTQAKADVNAECDTAISDASLATATELAKAVTYAGRILCIGAGNISNAQNAAEQYTITLDGVVYTVTAASLDTDGNRGTTVFSEV